MADIPASCVAYQQPPFTFTGLGYFGPLYVRRRRSTEKRYAHSLDANSCILAIQRMLARRG